VEFVEFIQKNIILVIVAVVSGVMLIWPTIAGRFSGIKHLAVADAVQLINRKDAVIVDVREPGEFKSGHIPHARNIPIGQIEARLKELEKLRRRPILLSCASGNRSGAAGGTLRKAGFEQVYCLAGGMAAWQQAAMPVEKD
jgi:rhodanese-related sulfurtransferase